MREAAWWWKEFTSVRPRPKSSARRLPGATVTGCVGWLAAIGLAVVDALADDVGQVLVQRAAAGDVDELGAPADGEHGQPALVRRADELELEGVQARLRRTEARRAARRRTPPGGCPGRRTRHRPSTRSRNGPIISDASGGTTTGTPPACWTASR